MVKIMFFSSLLSCTGMRCHIISPAMYHTVQSTYTWHCNFSVENDHRNSRHWLFLVIMCDLMCFLFSSENKLRISHVWPFLTFGSFRIEDRYQKQTAVFEKYIIECKGAKSRVLT